MAVNEFLLGVIAKLIRLVCMPLAGHLLWVFFGSCDIVRPEPGDLYKGGLEYPCYINWEI